ncbi:GNAT family N-acetyltransferase [Mycobacterium kyogaense]|uniref:GNAT family N-acetyltransferase n=1 Tax=Mycobacterium kyogaense TaxID=2212479 RepID=UPI000DADF7B3|nr:GNAT family N-acetyltransferase [Mycobacterium kyogaense]
MGGVVEVARQLVLERFPSARAAWLGGSHASGQASAGSDLDITVLLAGEPAPYRCSRIIEGLPVEFFVQTEHSLLEFCRDERARRRPTTMRLVGSSIILVDRDGSGRQLRDLLHRMDCDGPEPVDRATLEAMRYRVSALADDLVSSSDTGETLVVAAALIGEAADLVLATHRRWSGTGRWLLRELSALDTTRNTAYAERLLDGLRATAAGDPGPLHASVVSVVDVCGGPLFDGYLRGDLHAVQVMTASVDDAEVPALLAAATGGGDRLDHVAGLYRRDPRYALLRAEMAGETVGLLGYTLRGSDVVILHIATRAEYRRSGIGRRMLDALRATHPDHQRLCAETDSEAVGFYLANGFAVESLGEKYPGVERFHVHTLNTVGDSSA